MAAKLKNTTQRRPEDWFPPVRAPGIVTADDLTGKADASTQIISGAGLTGGGDLSANRTLAVGAGAGIVVNPDDVAIDTTAEAERIRDIIGAALVAGANIAVTVNDLADTITIAVTGLTNYTDEQVRDVIGAALVAGTGVTITVNDPADTITITSSVTQYTDEMAQDAIGAALTNTSRIAFTYDDLANAISADIVNGSIGTTQLIDAGVTLAKMANLAADSFIGNNAALAATPIALTVAQAKTLLAITAADVSGLGVFATGTDAANLTGTVAVAQLPALTGGDVTSSAGSGTLTIGAGKVTLAMQANMATASVVYRKTAGAGAPEVQTLATLKTDLGLTGTNSGDQTTISGNAGSATVLQTSRNFSITGGGITAAAVGFDGSAAVALSASVDAGHITLARMANLVANSFIGNNTGLSATPIAMTVAQAKTLLAITESDVASLTTDLAAKAPLASPQFTGAIFYQQPSPTAVNATATLTIAQLLTIKITVTSTTAVSLTLPTGTLTDAGILSGALAVNEAFDWRIINLGSSSGAVTLVAGTGHTIVGGATVAIGTSAEFSTRKTATNTFITYRIA